MSKIIKHEQFTYEVYDSAQDLSPDDSALLAEARTITAKAYAPYSHFFVGAVAKLDNGETIAGTNQENASYPVGICAERVLLSNASMQHTGIPIHTIAISYDNSNAESDKPISPCGMCRQSLREYEERMKHPIRLILSGQSGKVYILESAGQLLPLSFGSEDMPGFDKE
jgi:cytidine deaminase